LIQQ